MLQLRSSAAMARALDQPTDPHLRALFARRVEQLGLPEITDAAWFAVVEPGDDIAAVEAEIGFPLTVEGEPCFDWIMPHPGGWYELALDFGELTHVLLVQDRDGTDPDLLAVCREHGGHRDASDRAAQV